ncbi:integrator complex subunit 2-like isoform X2 [Actinia tenebrosa]|uniref:Integrator complex subunit 2-like isoform X2 n=1 Tax=Actinia tenebrosa TaxID=6105 RepID=A0A6P8HT36_ACTTE|nr:integrator complex subunit 2-like isoform X2 [Actinia tenebrosa]
MDLNIQMLQDIPTARAFNSMRSASVTELSALDTKELRPLLPCLVRMALCSPVDQSPSWTEARKGIQKILSGLEVVNSIVALLSVDFSVLEQDASKEQELRRKVGGAGGASVLVESLQNELALEFERSEPSRRLRLILSELLRIMSKISLKEEFIPEKSELFQCEVFLEEVSDVICIAQAELPSLLPLEQVAETLLRVKYGPWLLCRLVANVPDKFEQVCFALISNGEVQDDSSLGGMIRTQALRQLCTMNPAHALVMQAEATRLCCLPGLAVALALDFGSGARSNDRSGGDLIAFLSGLILGGNLKVRNWFAEFVKIGQKSSSSILHALRSQLLKEVSSLIPKRMKKDAVIVTGDSAGESTGGGETHEDRETMEILEAMQMSTDFEIVEEEKPLAVVPEVETFESLEISEDDIIHASALLRLYCGLKNLAGMKLTHEETEVLLSLITCHAPPTAAGVRFVVIGLCTLLACPQIISTPEHEQKAIHLIKWLSKEESHYETASGVHASFGEVLLLISIHFHSNQLESIAELVSSILSMKTKAGPLSRVKSLFTQELFPEKVITSHAVTVPVTPQLNGNMTGFLPIHCIHQLLKSRAFTKHYVPVKNWVYRQLCTCITPLHPLVPGLVEVYVNSIINPSSKAFQQGFTEAEILAIFKGTADTDSTSLIRRPSVYMGNDGGEDMESSLTSRLLMLYYVLLYQDCLLNNMKALVNSEVQQESYSTGLLAHIPIKYLVLQARSRQSEFRGLYAPLLRLLVTHYPHLCLVDEWLIEEEMQDKSYLQGVAKRGVSGVLNVRCSPLKLKEALSVVHENPSMAMLILTKLVNIEPSNLIPYTDPLVNALPSIVLPSVPRRVQMLCCELWSKISTVIPRKLWLATINVLCQDGGPSSYTDEDLIRDPLTVLRCSPRIFRCPPVFDILVRILRGYLAASRTMLSQHLQANPVTKRASSSNYSSTNCNMEQEREELRIALVAAQESAAIQLLLEICLPSKLDKQDGNSMDACLLREIQCRVCSSLHQIFIADPAIAKLVHFQGYPSKLLPVTVAGVPSMHICLDFIPELVNQPQIEKQLFAIQLASYLCLQYPLPKAMGVAKYVLSRLSSLLAALPSSKRASFFIPTLPALVRFCRAFPPLHPEATSFLVQLGKVAASHAKVTTNFVIGSYDSLLERLSQGINLGAENIDVTTDHEDHGFTDDANYDQIVKTSENKDTEASSHSQDIKLCELVEKTFAELVRISVLKQHEVSS